MKKGYLAILAFAVLGALVAGCGSSNDSSSETSSGSSAATSGGAYGGGGESSSAANEESSSTAGAGGGETALISTGKGGDLGTIIVDSEGMTLYDFHKDKGTTSSCYGACETAWPPLSTSGEAQAKNGAQASMLGTTERKDGTMQVTYNGHPLYTFAEDKKPGEANGNDFSAFGAQWYALMPNGEEPPD